jgi:hypothetical protein
LRRSYISQRKLPLLIGSGEQEILTPYTACIQYRFEYTMEHDEMELEYTTTYQPDAYDILLVRSLFNYKKLLPLELVDRVLDEAEYWILDRTILSSLPHAVFSSGPLLSTPPLFQAHMPQPRNYRTLGAGTAPRPTRNNNPCRMLVFDIEARAMSYQEGGIVTPSCGPSSALSPGKIHFTLQVDRTVTNSSTDFVLHPESLRKVEIVADQVIFEEPLDSKHTTRARVCWKWNDSGPEGHLVGCLEWRDVLKLSSGRCALGLGMYVWKLQLEVYYAI